MLDGQYIADVKAALWSKESTQQSETPADAMLQMHLRQGTATMVFPRMKMTPAMKMVCLQNMQQQVKLSYTLAVAWKALEQAGIEAVLMKGAGLAALYPEPHLRQWGDIDLFVGKEQYHPACAAMRKAFPEALKFDEELEHYKHYNLIADGISIEVHRVTMAMTHPLDERRYGRMEKYGVSHALEMEIGDCRVKVFEPTFNALFVFMHSWEHMMTQGANLRQICDLCLLLHHEKKSIDRLLLELWLRSLRMTEVWQIYMWICVVQLGLSEEEAPLFKEWKNERVRALRGERLLTALLEGRMKEPQTEPLPACNRFVRKWHTMKIRMRNAERIAAFSPVYARHMKAGIVLSGLGRLFAKDRHWE